MSLLEGDYLNTNSGYMWMVNFLIVLILKKSFLLLPLPLALLLPLFLLPHLLLPLSSSTVRM